MNLLALDLGSTTGYAIFKNDSIISGSKKLQHSKHASGLRFLDFRCWLIQIIRDSDIKEVYFERVYRHIGTDAAHAFGGFMYHLAVVCEELSVKCIGIPVGTIKKSATGSGKATKQEMINAVREIGFAPCDHNEADALAILLLALRKNNSNIKGPFLCK